MKYLCFVYVCCALVFVSCEKEINDLEVTRSNENVNKEAPIRGEIACIIYNGSGEAICAGKRCGTPTGECGKKYTECACIDRATNSPETSNDFSFEEFKIQWNDETGREHLKAAGYFALDE
jgi:hypothetical protein